MATRFSLNLIPYTLFCLTAVLVLIFLYDFSSILLWSLATYFSCYSDCSITLLAKVKVGKELNKEKERKKGFSQVCRESYPTCRSFFYLDHFLFLFWMSGTFAITYPRSFAARLCFVLLGESYSFKLHVIIIERRKKKNKLYKTRMSCLHESQKEWHTVKGYQKKILRYQFYSS